MILTILAGIGAIAITQFKVRPHLQGIIEERNRQEKRAETAESNLRQTKKTLADTEDTLRTTRKDLTDTQATLKTTKNDLDTTRTRANELQKTLDRTAANLRAKEQELSAWTALGIPVEQVRAVIESEKKLRLDLEALQAEKRIITDELNRALAKIDMFLKGKGEDFEVPLPPMRGKVLVVDPKWKFVVLNLGSQDKVEENGVLMVSRDGKLIAKVKIKRVQETRCIANVLPGWSFDEIMEGDLVLN